MEKRFAVLVVALAVLSLAQAPAPVPVADEPCHHVKFENASVRVFDVVVPPGGQTLFHRHQADYVYVVVGDATLKSEAAGQPAADLVVKNGETRFTKGPLVHRVVNVGPTPFHNLTIELLAAPAAKVPAEGTPEPPLLENERLRADRLVLEPGQSTGMHTHALPGIAVIVSGSTVSLDRPGQPAAKADLPSGAFQWREAITHSITNVGKTRFEVVDISIK